MTIAVFPVFRLLTDFVCLLTYEFCLSLWKIARCSVIVLGKRTESHRTKSHRKKSHKTPKTKSHRTKSHNLYFLPWQTKSHRTKSHNLYFCLTCMQVGQEVTIYIYTLIHVPYVGRTKSHNMYTPRFMYGMQVGQKVTV